MSYGRRVIYTDATEITVNNVVDEVHKAFQVHIANRAEIKKLYEVYRGKTNILQKRKEVRESINHQINENRAYEVVSFHRGYVFGEPIQYVRRENTTDSHESDDLLATDINALNGHMSDADKATCDNKLATWMYVCGTSYRMILPNESWEKDGDEAPFKLYSLDPRQTFVAYSNDVDHRPMMGVYYVKRENGERVFCVYTENAYYEFKEFTGGVTEQGHMLGGIPIIEYAADDARLGSFEIAMPLLDALDELQSNRMDDVVQTVNSFLAILGGQLDEETYKKLNDWKTLCLPEGVDAKYLSVPMSQSDLQTLKDDLYEAIYTICGIPNRNGGTSTSDTGTAVIYRDGYATADARARATELMFKSSEKSFLKLALRILRDTTGTKLRLTDIATHFTRRNYENITAKAQVLTTMLKEPKIHPELAYQYCGMFIDPESAYLMSKAYYEEQMAKWEPVEVDENEVDNDVPGSGQSAGNSEETAAE